MLFWKKERLFWHFLVKRNIFFAFFWCIGLLPPLSLETESVGRWMGILGKSLRIRDEDLKNYLSVCADF